MSGTGGHEGRPYNNTGSVSVGAAYMAAQYFPRIPPLISFNRLFQDGFSRNRRLFLPSSVV